jgi:hypothetical protein
MYNTVLVNVNSAKRGEVWIRDVSEVDVSSFAGDS